MAKRTRSGGVAADEEDSESCEASRHRRRCSSSGRHQFSRLDPDLVLEIAARLPSPCDARSLALASAELYSAIRPALSRVAFLTRYLRRRGVPGGPQRPPGFFLSTGSKTGRRRRREGPAPVPDTVFVRGPRNILRGYNVVDPATFRGFLATARRRRAHVVASSGHLLLCANGDGAGARYSVVNPATDLWISLPQPPSRLEEAAAAYAGCPAFHCTSGTELTVAYLARRRRHSEHLLVAHWFTSASDRWRSAPTAAHGHLRPAAAAARVGGAFYWMLVNVDAGSGCANAGQLWPLQKHSPCAVMALNTNTAKSWKVPCPLMAVGEGEAPIAPFPRGLAMLREADGLLRYCHTTRYTYPHHFRDLKLDGEYLDVWTLEAAAGDSPAAAGEWQLRVLGDGDSAAAHADEGVDAEFWTWVLYNNIQASATCGCRAEDVAAGHAYGVFRYSPDSAS